MPPRALGVHIQEVPDGVPRIAGVETSFTGFIGRALRGPINDPKLLHSFAEFEREFGGLWSDSPLSYALQQYFLNGGQKAVVVRVKKGTGSNRNNTRTSGEDAGGAIGFAEIAAPGLKDQQHGLWAFDKTDLINLLYIPPFSWQVDVDVPTWKAALEYCKARRAFLLVDPPSTWKKVEDAVRGLDAMDIRDGNATMYFPRLRMADPQSRNRLKDFAPGGAVAGVMARSDINRGVWKAPAGLTLIGVPDLSIDLSSADRQALIPHGINSLRKRTGKGCMIWGAHTLLGTDSASPEWKYVAVRRLTLFIEESLSRGTQWVVFEPNDESLWVRIRQNVGSFMIDLWRQGALFGAKPDHAYFVTCGPNTTTQADIDQGIINILVGFAPIRPEEFITLKITQRTGNP